MTDVRRGRHGVAADRRRHHRPRGADRPRAACRRRRGALRPLGAGKTALAKGIARGMDVEGPVTSPTYVLARVHQPGQASRPRRWCTSTSTDCSTTAPST